MKSFKILGLVFLAVFSFALAIAQTPSIYNLVDSFKNATELQRSIIMNENFGKDIVVGGKIMNVEEYNFFNEKKDLVKKYYRISLEGQKTDQGIPYQVIFLYKDFEKAKSLNKGEELNKEGKIIRIINERLQISVWLFDGELTSEEIELFQGILS